MGHLGISEVETFNALRTYCRNNRKRVVDIAEQVVKHELEIDLTPYLKK
jgi:AmiR/NasT family two-component response regulator